MRKNLLTVTLIVVAFLGGLVIARPADHTAQYNGHTMTCVDSLQGKPYTILYCR